MSLGSTKDGRQPYNQDYPAQFAEFWPIYPRHRDKRKALKAWRNAIGVAQSTDINAGAIRYRDDPNRLDEFTKYAEGWLNGDGWEDEPLPSRLPDAVRRRASAPTRDARSPRLVGSSRRNGVCADKSRADDRRGPPGSSSSSTPRPATVSAIRSPTSEPCSFTASNVSRTSTTTRRPWRERLSWLDQLVSEEGL